MQSGGLVPPHRSQSKQAELQCNVTELPLDVKKMKFIGNVKHFLYSPDIDFKLTRDPIDNAGKVESPIITVL